MELTMTNSFGFCELNENEMMMIDGGSKEAAQAIMIIGGAVLLGVGAPIIGAVAGAGMFATAYVAGVGLMGSAFFI